jgi:hypothetical protein
MVTEATAQVHVQTIVKSFRKDGRCASCTQNVPQIAELIIQGEAPANNTLLMCESCIAKIDLLFTPARQGVNKG